MSSGRIEWDLIRAITLSADEGPVLMLNLNRYVADSGYPDTGVYQDYMVALDSLLHEVGGRILWRTPVSGQPVGEQPLDEVLAVWYPSHQAFLDLQTAPGSKENFRLRKLCVEYAVIHRCSGVTAPLTPA